MPPNVRLAIENTRRLAAYGVELTDPSQGSPNYGGVEGKPSEVDTFRAILGVIDAYEETCPIQVPSKRR